MPTVLIPQLLRELTGGAERVEVEGATLRRVFNDLERQYPGTRARLVENGEIRPEISVAVDGSIAGAGLLTEVPEGGEVAIVPAISGGSRAEGLR